MILLENGRSKNFLTIIYGTCRPMQWSVLQPWLMRLLDVLQPFHPLVLCLLVLLTWIPITPKCTQCIFQSPMLTTERWFYLALKSQCTALTHSEWQVRGDQWDKKQIMKDEALTLYAFCYLWLEAHHWSCHWPALPPKAGICCPV